MTGAVDHPAHYNGHQSGIEAIDVCEHMSFNLGNAMKYLWRADLKGKSVEDLQKSAWYVAREIERMSKSNEQTGQEPKVSEMKSNDKLAINAFVESAHSAAVTAGWWHSASDRSDLRNLMISRSRFGLALAAAKLCLIHSDISEAMEGVRKDLMDDKLPHRKMIEVELADAMIRIADLAGAMGMDLGGAIVEKMAYNEVRADHQPEHRAAAGGKAF